MVDKREKEIKNQEITQEDLFKKIQEMRAELNNIPKQNRKKSQQNNDASEINHTSNRKHLEEKIAFADFIIAIMALQKNLNSGSAEWNLCFEAMTTLKKIWHQDKVFTLGNRSTDSPLLQVVKIDLPADAELFAASEKIIAALEAQSDKNRYGAYKEKSHYEYAYDAYRDFKKSERKFKKSQSKVPSTWRRVFNKFKGFGRSADNIPNPVSRSVPHRRSLSTFNKYRQSLSERVRRPSSPSDASNSYRASENDTQSMQSLESESERESISSTLSSSSSSSTSSASSTPIKSKK